MATHDKTFTFDSTLESWVFTSGGKGSEIIRTGVLCIESIGRNNSDTSYYEWTGTWEDLGIPSGATVTEVGSGSLNDYDWRCTVWNVGVSGSVGPFEFYDNQGTPVLQGTFSSAEAFTGTTSFATKNGSAISVPSGLQASNSTIKLRLSVSMTLGNDKAAEEEVEFDNIALTITYTPAAPSDDNINIQNEYAYVSEDITIIPDLAIDIYDPVIVTEFVDKLIPELYKDVYDNAYVSDIVDNITLSGGAPADLEIDVYENVGVSDLCVFFLISTSLLIPAYIDENADAESIDYNDFSIIYWNNNTIDESNHFLTPFKLDHTDKLKGVGGKYVYMLMPDGTNENMMMRFSTTLHDFYCRFYIKIDSNFSFTDDTSVLFVYMRSTSPYQYPFEMHIELDGLGGTPYRWRILTDVGTTYDTDHFSLDEWHCVEFRVANLGTGNSIYQVWLDEDLIMNQNTGALYNDIDRLYIGLYEFRDYVAGYPIYVDQIVVSQTGKIGLYDQGLGDDAYISEYVNVEIPPEDLEIDIYDDVFINEYIDPDLEVDIPPYIPEIGYLVGAYAERGNTSEFDYVTQASGNTFTADPSAKRYGNYGFKAAFAGTASGCEGQINISAQDEVYQEFDLYIPTGFTIGSSNWWNGIQRIRTTTGGTSEILTLSLYGNGSTTPDRWRIYAGTSYQDYTTNFSFDEWHHIVLYCKPGTGSDGEARVWVDGDLIHEETGLSAFPNRPVQQILIGGYGSYYPANGSLLYFDNLNVYGASHQVLTKHITGETGDTSEFTSVVAGGTSQFIASSTASILGNYGFQGIADGTSQTQYGRYDLSVTKSNLFVSFLIFIPEDISGQTTYQNGYVLKITDSSGGDLARLSLQTNGSSQFYRLYGVLTGGTNTYSPTNAISEGKIYHIEVEYLAGSGTDAVMRCWCNGALMFEITDGTVTDNAGRVYAGNQTYVFDVGKGFYIDEIKIAEEHIINFEEKAINDIVYVSEDVTVEFETGDLQINVYDDVFINEYLDPDLEVDIPPYIPEIGYLFGAYAERGNTSEFDSIVENGSNQFIASQVQVLSGNYSFQTISDGSNTGAYGVVSNLNGGSGYDEIYISLYLYIPSDISGQSTYEYGNLVVIKNASYIIGQFGLITQDTAQFTRMSIWLEGSQSDETSDGALIEGEIQHIEMRLKKGTGNNAIGQIWIDGDLVAEVTTGQITSNIIEVQVGQINQYIFDSGKGFFIDNIELYDKSYQPVLRLANGDTPTNSQFNTVVEPGSTIFEASTNSAFFGNYGIRVVGDGVNQNVYGEWSNLDKAELHGSFYFYIPTQDPFETYGVRVFIRWAVAGDVELGYMAFNFDGAGVLRTIIGNVYGSSGYQSPPYGTTINDILYRVDWSITRDGSSNPILKMWLDGSLIVDFTGDPGTITGNIQTMRIGGLSALIIPDGTEIYFDEIKIAEEHIINFEEKAINDIVYVSEDVTVEFETGDLQINVYDDVFINEYLDFDLEVKIESYDDIAYVSEYVNVEIELAAPLTIDVYDSIFVSDVPDKLLESNINIYDDSFVSEYINFDLEIKKEIYDNVFLSDVPTVQIEGVSDLEIDVYDSVFVSDVPDKLLISFIDIYDDSFVSEYVNVEIESVAPLTINIYDNIFVSEFIANLLESNISIYDDAFTSEFLKLELEIKLYIYDDSLVSEFVNAQIESVASLNINVYENVFISEFIDNELEIKIEVYDDSFISEFIKSELEIKSYLYDDVFILDILTVQLESIQDLNINIYDAVFVSENLSFNPESFVNVYDDSYSSDILIVEIELIAALNIDVYDDVFVSEYSNSELGAIPEWNINVYDIGFLNEFINVEIIELTPNFIDLFDIGTVNEFVNVSLEAIPEFDINVFDISFISEFINVQLEEVISLNVNVYDESFISEYLNFELLEKEYISDNTFVTDIPIVEIEGVTPLIINIYDDIFVSDILVIGLEAIQEFNIDVYESAFLSENIGVFYTGPMLIDVYENVVVIENFLVFGGLFYPIVESDLYLEVNSETDINLESKNTTDLEL